MKKEEKINKLAEELLNTATDTKSKTKATIILSTFDKEDGENTGVIIAASGTVVGLAATITMAMMKSEELKEAIMMAASVGGMMGGDSPFPMGLAALLGGKR